MSVMEPPIRSAREIAVSPARPWSARLADYRELTKPRIAVMALITVTCGFLMAGSADPDLSVLPHALLGIALVAGACGTLNQYVERESDTLMKRTANRPLPAGRMAPIEALLFGAGLGAAGLIYLTWFVNTPTAVLSAVTLLLYAAVYTPMKRMSSWCTIVGAIPGAMPPLLGWSAAGGGPLIVPISLFGILYVWQFPHLLSIAWLYREQYAAAGLHMLPGQIPRRGLTGALSTIGAVVMIPVSLLPWQAGIAGSLYASVALVLGGGYLYFSIVFWRNETRRTARRLLWSSLLYLPIVLAVLAFDFARLS